MIQDNTSSVDRKRDVEREKILYYMLERKHRHKIHITEVVKDLRVREQIANEVLLDIKRVIPELGDFEYSTGWFVYRAYEGRTVPKVVPWVILVSSILAVIGLSLLQLEGMFFILYLLFIAIAGISIRVIMKQNIHADFPAKEQTPDEAMVNTSISTYFMSVASKRF